MGDDKRRPALPRTAADWGACAALGAAYFASGKLGLKLALVNPSATAVWPPTGIALAALILLGPKAWPGVFAGAFLTNITTAGTTATSLGIALGNTLEALAGAALVGRFASGASAFERPRDVVLFALLAAGLAPAISATLGVLSLALGGFAPWANAGTVWLTWWLGDFGGALTFAPLVILLIRSPAPRWARARVLEAAAIAVVLVVLTQFVFGGWLPEGLRSSPIGFVCIPALVWTAFRFGPREAACASFALSALAAAGTLRGLGPFAGRDPNVSLLLLQVFIATAAVLALVFAAAVNERRRAELALRRAYDELDVQVKQRTAELSKANAELQMFTAIASHDLQEPLHKILNFADLLKNRAAGLADVEKDMLARIQRSALAMSRLVEDLLTLSRVMRDPRPFEPVDLKAVLSEVLGDLEDAIAQAGAKVEAGPLPVLRAHPIQMRQLLQNLVANAVKFRDKNRALVVKVFARETTPGFIDLSVEDNGIGFDAAQAERIFQPFVSLYVRGEYPGSGIGLAICRRIAVRHGGVIAARGVPGQGAAFTVTLPYAGRLPADFH